MAAESGPASERKLGAWDPTSAYGSTGAGSSAACRFQPIAKVLCTPVGPGASAGGVGNECNAVWADNWADDEVYDEDFDRTQLEGSTEVVTGNVKLTIPDTDTYKYYYLNAANEWVALDDSDGVFTFNHCLWGNQAAAGIECSASQQGGFTDTGIVLSPDGTLSGSQKDELTIGVASKCDGAGAAEQIFAWAKYSRDTGKFEIEYEQEHDTFSLAASNVDPYAHDLVYVFGQQADKHDDSMAANQNLMKITDTNNYQIACSVSLTVSTPGSAAYDQNCYSTSAQTSEDPGNDGSTGYSAGACQAALAASCTMTEQAPLASGIVTYSSAVSASLKASGAIVQSVHMNAYLSDAKTNLEHTAQDYLDADAAYTPSQSLGYPTLAASYSCLTADADCSGHNPYRIVGGYYEKEYNYGCSATGSTVGENGVPTHTCTFDQTTTTADNDNTTPTVVSQDLQAIPAHDLGPLPDGYPNFYVFGIYTIDLDAKTSTEGTQTQQASADNTFGAPARRLGASAAEGVDTVTARVYM